MPIPIVTEEPPTAQEPNRPPLAQRRAIFSVIEDEYKWRRTLLRLLDPPARAQQPGDGGQLGAAAGADLAGEPAGRRDAVSTATHTQGRWYAEKNDEHHWSVNCESPNGSEGSDSWLADLLFDVTGETEANAKLMAAAPDLLEAIQSAAGAIDYALDAGGFGPLHDQAIDTLTRAKAAITKATGEQP